jgi:hypothetical protein
MVSCNLSIVILVSAGGSLLDRLAVRNVPGSRIVEADFAAAETVCCAALRLSHECTREELQAGLREWAGARGWSVAVAPCPESG